MIVRRTVLLVHSKERAAFCACWAGAPPTGACTPGPAPVATSFQRVPDVVQCSVCASSMLWRSCALASRSALGEPQGTPAHTIVKLVRHIAAAAAASSLARTRALLLVREKGAGTSSGSMLLMRALRGARRAGLQQAAAFQVRRVSAVALACKRVRCVNAHECTSQEDRRPCVRSPRARRGQLGDACPRWWQWRAQLCQGTGAATASQAQWWATQGAPFSAPAGETFGGERRRACLLQSHGEHPRKVNRRVAAWRTGLRTLALASEAPSLAHGLLLRCARREQLLMMITPLLQQRAPPHLRPARLLLSLPGPARPPGPGRCARRPRSGRPSTSRCRRWESPSPRAPWPTSSRRKVRSLQGRGEPSGASGRVVHGRLASTTALPAHDSRAAGDSIAVDEVIAQVETDKVTIDIKYQGAQPGKITKLHIKEQDVVQVGNPVASVEVGAAGATAPAAAPKPAAAAAPAPPPPPPPPPAQPAAPAAPAPPKVQSRAGRFTAAGLLQRTPRLARKRRPFRERRGRGILTAPASLPAFPCGRRRRRWRAPSPPPARAPSQSGARRAPPFSCA